MIKSEQQTLARAKVTEFSTSNRREQRAPTLASLRQWVRRIVYRDYPNISKEEADRIVSIRIARGMTEYVAIDVPVRHSDQGYAEMVWKTRRARRAVVVKSNHDHRR
jgi:hypothetical protein